MLHKNLPPWKSFAINAVCFVLWVALNVLDLLAKFGVIVVSPEFYYVANGETSSLELDYSRQLTIATAVVYAVHTAWAGVVYAKAFWVRITSPRPQLRQRAY